MCWQSKSKPELKIADEDIQVFKIIRQYKEELYSFYNSFKYEIGILYKENIGIPSKDVSYCVYNIDEGFHSYSSEECMVEITFGGEALFSSIYTKRGKPTYPLDICMYYEGAPFCNVKADCIIPTGSEYYLNENGEYVSNQIKIIEYKSLK